MAPRRGARRPKTYDELCEGLPNHSLFVLGKGNPMRKAMIKVVKSQTFDQFILLLILANCVFLAMDSNAPDFYETDLGCVARARRGDRPARRNSPTRARRTRPSAARCRRKNRSISIRSNFPRWFAFAAADASSVTSACSDACTEASRAAESDTFVGSLRASTIAATSSAFGSPTTVQMRSIWLRVDEPGKTALPPSISPKMMPIDHMSTALPYLPRNGWGRPLTRRPSALPSGASLPPGGRQAP